MRRREFLRSTLAGAAVLVPGSGASVNWDWITSVLAVPAVEPLMPINASFANIFRAADSGFVNDVKYFIEKMGINVNVKGMYGFTPIHWAAGRCKSLEIVQYLISQGADVHACAKGCFGDTSLHRAAMFNANIEVLQYLIAQGVNVHAKNDDGKTPLDVTNSEEKKHILREAMAKQ